MDTVFRSAPLSAAVLLLALGLPAAARAQGPYPLDAFDRTVGARGAPRCPDVGLVTYRGTHLHYGRAIRVATAFVPKLEALEVLVRQVAEEHYGRAPERIVHLGAFNCRRMRGYPDLVSEHGLGNALDVAGFDFARAPRGAGTSRSLARPFRVRLDKHWNATRGDGKIHAAFLRDLAQRVVEAPDLFRVVLGPAWPGHRNHFHFDCAPYRLTSVF
jgi:hypothetical protein